MPSPLSRAKTAGVPIMLLRIRPQLAPATRPAQVIHSSNVDPAASLAMFHSTRLPSAPLAPLRVNSPPAAAQPSWTTAIVEDFPWTANFFSAIVSYGVHPIFFASFNAFYADPTDAEPRHRQANFYGFALCDDFLDLRCMLLSFLFPALIHSDSGRLVARSEQVEPTPTTTPETTTETTTTSTPAKASTRFIPVPITQSTTSESPSSTSSTTPIPSTTSSAPARSTWTPTPITSVMTVTGQIKTITITPTAPPTATGLAQSRDGGFMSHPGKVAGLFVGVGLVTCLLAAALLWFFYRRKRDVEAETIASTVGEETPQRRQSKLSTMGLLGGTRRSNNRKSVPTIQTSGWGPGNSTEKSPTDTPIDYSRTSYPRIVDQRLEPTALWNPLQDNGSHVSIQSFRDDQDYSRRMLRVANPDDRPVSRD
ncbi:MAG: hypothetical protein Q9210_005355 [Variospora velana]